MKVPELREKLTKLKKEELIKLAVEFYKLVPKSKKEDNDLDKLIENPTQPKAVKQTNTSIDWEELEQEINEFISNAKEQYYVYPNKIVSKKERSTWRFKVKKWYKLLTNTKQKDVNPELQVKLAINLYELLCEGCDYMYFSSNDPFQSIQVEQRIFFKSLIVLIQEKIGKSESVDKGIELIVNNSLDRSTLKTYLAFELIATLQIPDLKERGIKKVEQLLEENKLHYENLAKELEDKKDKKGRVIRDYGLAEKRRKLEYNIETINNDLTLIGLLFYESLYRIKDGIAFYNAHYTEKDEIKLYILINEIFKDEYKNEIKSEIERAIQNGIEPRKALLNTLKIINDGEKLPRRMPW
ncbi:MAG: hypothetical protein COZ18_08105 [Flexibacter sp. CG_4_10_14_3_um_filter_32_15]|nr:MAG: hypothetical protein COZ18_08105 [Flexibacter sp. CG_4_10_14_3_um_filter_32_15]